MPGGVLVVTFGDVLITYLVVRYSGSVAQGFSDLVSGVVARCRRPSINEITPYVSIDISEGFYHPDQFRAAQITLGFDESTGDPPYDGTGTATVEAGNATLYSDSQCNTPIAESLAADNLRDGVPVYVKGAAAGDVTVRLTLTDPNDPRLLVNTQEDGDVTITAVNEVTPDVHIDVQEGFYHPNQYRAAQVTLSIVESTGDPPYDGTGTATVEAGNATLYSDSQCNTLLGQLGADDLRNGVQVYVRGGAAGDATVRLTLTDPNDPRLLVNTHKDGDVTITAVNEITPVLTGDELALFYKNFADPGATTLSQLQVGFQESNPGHAPPDLAVRVTYDNKIACFEDANQTTAFNTNDTLARARLGAPFTLHVRGAAAGNCAITAAVVGTPGSAWRFAPAVNKTLRVERLALAAYRYRDGRTTNVGAINNLAAGNPKTRELHQWNGNIFTFARFIMRQPSNAFWAKATRVTLSVNGGAVATFSNNTATHALANISQQAFGGQDKALWVRATGVDAIDVEPGGEVDWNTWAQLLPEKVLTTCYVSCGATVQGTNRELVAGDVVRLQTFSLDRYLDRHVRNECGSRVQPNPADGTLTNRCALSKAAGHKYYDNESAFCENLAYRQNGANPFGNFIGALGYGNNAGHAATLGRNWVSNYLRDEHGVQLTDAMRILLRNYILNVLNGGGWGRGANWNNALPHNVPRPYNFSLLYGVPGTHAEVLAVNQVMANNVAANDITVATYMLQNQPGHGNRQGKRFVACPNCAGILNAGNCRVITG